MSESRTDFSDTGIIELAAIIAAHLREHEIDVVLVGGLAVELYTDNLYLTKDIDMVDISYQKPPRLHETMSELGFEKKGRVFVNPSTDISVEFPSAPVSVGDELVTETTSANTKAGNVPVLHCVDVIKDRMAAYVHWGDKPSLVQAITLLAAYPEHLEESLGFCEREGAANAVPLIQQTLTTVTETGFSGMEDIERLIVETTLHNL